MKKNLFYLLALLASSCTYNSEEELGALVPGNIEEAIDYQTSVRPIINQNCAVSGCHVSGTGLPDFTDDQEVVDRAEAIKSAVLDGRMPRNGTLSFQEKDTLVSWINQGADLE